MACFNISLLGVVPVLAYGLLNIASAVLIVVANKVVLHTYRFSFPVCLTWMHTIITAVGMNIMPLLGFFTVKPLPWRKTAPNAVAYVGYVVFNNMSIQINTLSFYQISKICVTPAVVLIEYIAYGKTVTRHKLFAVCLLLFGITIATVSDDQASSNSLGMLIAFLAVLSTALCQVWAGSKQKELEANGSQLLHQLIPTAVALLGVLMPALEPVGLAHPKPGTILGFNYTAGAIAWIVASSCLGLVVTLSSYLFIAVTSPLTFNVVGHLKTVLILAAGTLLFHDVLSTKKFIGLVCAVVGIIWYSVDGIASAGTAIDKTGTHGKGQLQQPAAGQSSGKLNTAEGTSSSGEYTLIPDKQQSRDSSSNGRPGEYAC